MGVPRRNLLTIGILLLLDLDQPLFPIETPYEWLARNRRTDKQKYQQSIRSLKRSGAITVIKKQNKEFIKLTHKGALRILLEKAKITKIQKWDCKWRVLVFDIPEDFRKVRNNFRKLLKQNNFIKLQASVFISPYPLSREAIIYLKHTKLINYIRIMKVEELDYDKDLRKKFNI